jgi:hypothetical protein
MIFEIPNLFLGIHSKRKSRHLPTTTSTKHLLVKDPPNWNLNWSLSPFKKIVKKDKRASDSAKKWIPNQSF